MDIIGKEINDMLYEMNENERITHYELQDGRIWSIDEAKFVSSIPENAILGSQPNIKILIDTLDFYHYPKGELKTDEEYAAEARKKRNILLTESDYLAMPDYPISEEKKSAILSYRQSLRDISKQSGFPRNINWPEKPEI